MTAESRWRIDGARAVVTGGTRGIGLAVVLELLELGASVVTAGRELDDLDPRLTPARDVGRVTLVARRPRDRGRPGRAARGDSGGVGRASTSSSTTSAPTSARRR